MATRSLPSGTVTFLFTDVEGSTKLLHALGPDAYAAALAAHRATLREAFAAHGGVEVDTQGDAFFVAFPTASGALAAALHATDALATGPIHVRIGLHTGTPLVTEEGYIGADVHKGARIAAAGHGGQVLVSSATASLLTDARLTDLGLHRLKDLTAPERIFQADDGEHPPLKTLHQTNLPIPATPFLGREAELADLGELFRRDDVRLVTLTGPGGTGKTRLALQAAADAADDYPQGVWWVPLAALRDPALVVESAAKVLGAAGDLVGHIGDRRLLLLLDNFEHLVSAADDIAPLLAGCPNLLVVVTSREPLHLRGEWEYAVDPLSRSDAVELFLTRAVAAKRDFVANGEVAEICARLDHLPLAIELAAARVKVLQPAALLARLEQRLPLLAGGHRDAPDRQRTLRATIEWSHELLTADEQALFARLAVFRGGCTMEDAEAVTDADLDTLQSLVDKSLVRLRADGRFWMLETIREFAVERLEASGERDDLRARHAATFLALAEEAEPHVLYDAPEWLGRLEADHDNLRAALDWMGSTGDTERFGRLATALWRFWYLRSHLLEGRRRLERVIASSDDLPALRAKALQGASVMTLNLGEADRALELAQRALDLERERGNAWGIAYATMMIGNCYSEVEPRPFEDALRYLEESSRRFEEIGDRHYGLIARHNQAWIRGELGDREGEKRLHAEDLAIARSIGNRAIEADALAQLGMAEADAGRFDDALPMLRAAVRIDHERGMVQNTATHLGRIGWAYAHLGRHRDAATLLAAEAGATEALGSRLPWWVADRHRKTFDALRAAGLGDVDLDAAAVEGRALSLEEAVELALRD